MREKLCTLSCTVAEKKSTYFDFEYLLKLLWDSQSYLRDMYPRFKCMVSYISALLRRSPTQNCQKTDLRVRSKMTKSAYLLAFWHCGATGVYTMPHIFSTESSLRKPFAFKKIWNFGSKIFQVTKSGVWMCHRAPTFLSQKHIIYLFKIPQYSAHITNR